MKSERVLTLSDEKGRNKKMEINKVKVEKTDCEDLHRFLLTFFDDRFRCPHYDISTGKCDKENACYDLVITVSDDDLQWEESEND